MPRWDRRTFFQSVGAAAGLDVGFGLLDPFGPDAPDPTLPPFRAKATSTDYDVEPHVDLVLADASASDIRVILPRAADLPGRRIDVKKIDISLNAVIVAGKHDDRIDRQIEFPLSQPQACLSVVSTDVAWVII